jgi:competence ComEA-like helix-hairpin-helix protein
MNRWLGWSALACVLVSGSTSAWCAQQGDVVPLRKPTPTNINTANVLELTELPGIGVKRAQAIVNWRSDHGPFKTKQALMDIPGIGTKIFESLESLISVRARRSSSF